MELISREDTWREFISKIEDIADLEDIDRILSSMPTTEERKEGHWIKQPSYKPFIDDETEITVAPKCSVCGKHGSFRNNYCPNCGAIMKGE